MSRKIPVNVAVAVMLIAMTVTFSVTMIVSMNIFDQTVSSVVAKQASYSKLAELDTYVRANYYGEIDNITLNDRIVQGYLSGIGDPYSTYYTEREYSELLEYEEGTRVGIGLETVKNADGTFTIRRVYPDSPAALIGIQQGGKITAVGETETRSISTVRALNSLLRGEAGTTVDLSVLYGNADEQQYSVQRSNYTAPTVEYQLVDDNYAYFRIYNFSVNTYSEFDFLLGQAIADNARGLVFDLRNNSGDYARSAYDIIDVLCPLGIVAKSESKSGVVKNIATSDEDFVDLPMVVLVNENTAAAAEIFAVSIRDLAGGTITGVKTMGKGMIQSSPQRLSDGSAVVITTAKLLTGNDESFDGVGILPDIEVPSTTDDETLLYDPQPNMDSQIARSLEALRSLIISRGGEAPELQLLPSTASSASAPATPTVSASDESSSLSASGGEDWEQDSDAQDEQQE